MRTFVQIVVQLRAYSSVYLSSFSSALTSLSFLSASVLEAKALISSTLGTRPSLSHVTARQEVESLLAALKLPLDDRGLRRAAARAEWFAAASNPLELHDIIGA